MSVVSKTSIALSREQADLLQEAVASGDFPDEEAALAQAFDFWREMRSTIGDAAALRTLWDEGLASGPAQPLDFDELRTEARRTLANARHGE
jgi:antitoxin ParD1/3/4